MDSTDAADLIAELHEDRQAQEQSEKLRNRAALMIALLAAVLAIGGLGGGNATDEMISSNIRASDTWAFFQAKNMRQTLYEIAADGLEAEIAASGTASPALPPARPAALLRRLSGEAVQLLPSQPERSPTSQFRPRSGRPR